MFWTSGMFGGDPSTSDGSARRRRVRLSTALLLCAVLIAGLVLGVVGCSRSAIVSNQPAQPYPPFPKTNAAPYVAPTDQQKQWALALAAIVAVQDDDQLDTLNGAAGPRNSAQLDAVRQRLSDSWDINSRSDLLRTLTSIEDGGQRQAYNDQHPGDAKSISAWDYGRYVALCRWGYAIGYLSEAEAWQRIMPVARLMQSTFSSWREYGTDYMTGREYWSPNASDAASIRSILDSLLTDNRSPWKRLPWDLHLDPEREAADPRVP